MATPILYNLNRGVVDRRGLARADVKRLSLAAQVQTNWLPRVLGPMSLRPGLGYLGSVFGDARERMLPFVFATDDLAAIELTDNLMRVWIDDQVLTRPAVATTITNPDFTTDLTGWTSFDDAGATSSWAAGRMQLVGNGSARAAREQHVTNASSGVEHGIRIVITRGPVSLRIGTSSGDDDLVGETTLYAGTHSLSITPTGDFYIRFFSAQAPLVLVESCNIEAAGVMTLPTPWDEDDLDMVRIDQSADVVFVACRGLQQRRIERRGDRPGARGWSVVLYQSPDGPFLVENTTTKTLTPSGITGNISVAASVPLFKPKHVGALFSITSVGQQTTVAASAVNTFSPAIRVTGIGDQRSFGIVITGTFVGTVVLQQSFDDAVWNDVPGQSWTAPVSTTYGDGLDNQIIFYRIGIEGTYTSGTANATLSFSAGSIRGVVRVTNYSNSQLVSAEVLAPLGGTSASSSWQEGKWSDVRGWPTAVGIHQGRLWWAGQNGVQGSISDAFDSFDETFAGDAGPIDRTVGSGPVDTINWIVSLKGMLVGAQGAEYSVRSSLLDEPLTPTNFNLNASTTQGSGAVDAVKVDQRAYMVDRTGCKVFEISSDARGYDFDANDLMELCPELGRPGIVRIAVQRKPDTRVHAIRSDGVALVGVMEPSEQVRAWVPVQTDGFIEDALVLPAKTGDLDDQVYYVVRRFINGATRRYFEKWAQDIDCRGDQPLCLLADAYAALPGISSNKLPVPHLNGQKVVVWADGSDIGTGADLQPIYTATNGVVTLPKVVTDAVVGLPYAALFQSAKLGLLVSDSAVGMSKPKRGDHIRLMLADTHTQGLRFGPNFNTVDDMPLIEDGAPVVQGVQADYDNDPIEFPDGWKEDQRICLLAQAPRPATVMAVALDME